jgi:molybdopterin/thiamine biosynthesis adenylyltransferase
MLGTEGIVMNFERIQGTVDVSRMSNSHVAIIGGGYGWVMDLVRCGLGAVTYVDFDRVSETNPARQDFTSASIGQYKVDAIAASLRQINPDVAVTCLARDFCALTADEIEQYFGDVDLFVFAADSFVAQARGNLESLRLKKPAIWIGLYREGRAGEIIYYVPGKTHTCYRCIAASRYAAFASQSNGAPNVTMVPSTGATIFDLHLIDAIAGQLAVGILTAGADNRMGRLIEQLGDRNLLQVKCDPMYSLGGKDIFGQYLGNDPANFSFTTIALAIEPEANCPDCASRAKVGSRCRGS